MRRFQHRPIDLEGRSLRLLRLCMAEDGNIRCELFDAHLDDEEGIIEYEALSYTWGGTYKSHDIEVNEHIMAVTKNLYMALHSLRRPREDRILWIDAICIDQENDKERGHQVLQMAAIYEKAQRVIIWLGPATPDTDAVFDCMSRFGQEMTKHVCKDWNVADKRWREALSSVQDSAGQERMRSIPEQRAGLEDLLARPWFDRVWIIQEVANARAAMVFCGTKSVSGRTFALFALLSEVTPSPHCQAILDVMPGPTRTHSWWSQKHDLFTLLLKFKGSEASDPRDIIYALLGISSDRFNAGFLVPNYERSTTEVIKDTVSYLLGLDPVIASVPLSLNWTLTDFLERLHRLADEVCLFAAGDGSESTVKTLLDAPTGNVNIMNHQGRTPLHQAAENGHAVIVELLLSTYNIDVDLEKTFGGYTPLLLAAKNGHDVVVTLLLQTAKVDVDRQNSNGETALLLAAANGYNTTVRLLLDSGEVDVNRKRMGGHTPLILAAKNGHDAVVRLLFQSGKVAVNQQNENGETALLLAAEKGHETIVRQILDTGAADSRLRDSRGWYPLWVAAINGFMTITTMLLQTNDANEFKPTQALQANKLMVGAMLETHQARRNTQSCRSNKQTPLWWAAHNGYLDLFQLLIETDSVDIHTPSSGEQLLQWAYRHGNKAAFRSLLGLLRNDLDLRDQWARNLLNSAARSGEYTTMQLMIATGRVDALCTGDPGRDLIIAAVVAGHKAIVELLLDSGNNDSLGTGRAIWTAAQHGRVDLLQMILDRVGADVNYRLIDQQTPLWKATFNKHSSVVKVLLSASDIQVNAKDTFFEQTPLSLAAESGCASIVELLLESGKADIQATDRHGKTPLELAIAKGHSQVVSMLVEYGTSDRKPMARSGDPVKIFGEYTPTILQWKRN